MLNDPQIDDHGPFNSLDMLKNKPGNKLKLSNI